MIIFRAREMQPFRVIWFGQFISALGSGLTSFAFGVWIFQKTESTTLFALNILAFTLPSILFSPVIGMVVDRADRRLVMILSDIGSGLTMLAVGVLFLSGHLQIWQVYATTFINAAFSSLQWTAQSATTALIVPKQYLGRASGLVAASDAISMLVSPALSGVLYVSIGLTGIIVIDFATFLFAVTTLLFIHIPKPQASRETRDIRGTFIQEAAFGWKYIQARPGMSGLLVYFTGLYFIVGMVDPLLQPMILEMTGPEVMGMIISTMGAGYLLGTLLMSAWGGPKQRALGILITGIVQGLVMVGLGISISLVVVAASVFLFSLLDPIVGGSSQAFWQVKVPPEIQGRVFAVRRTLSKIGQAVALLVAGPLAEKVFEPLLIKDGLLAESVGKVIGAGPGRGTGFLFIVLGLLFALVSILGLLYSPLRKADSEIPDATGPLDVIDITPSTLMPITRLEGP